MQRSLSTLHANDVDVLAIGFAAQERLDVMRDELGLTFPLISDPDRRWYAVLGATRGRWRDVYAPRILRRYLRALFRRERIPLPHDDLRQLGADVVLQDGRIVHVWSSHESERRPTVAEIIATVTDRPSSSALPNREA